jgi:hypothetical protein
MYTWIRYTSEVPWLLHSYKKENKWVTWWPSDPRSIARGWNMYKASSNNALGFLLLGDTAIRANKDLLFNFGLNSAHGVQEEKDVKMIEEQMNKRQRLATPGMAATELLGPGSILSDKFWTPLLNDSFILGGINGRQEFHLAFATKDDDKDGVLKSYTGTDPKEKWKAYLIGNPNAYWDGKNKIPRVFARETLGLMFFGYRPVFTSQELGFECVNKSAAAGATFTNYTAKLREVEYDKNNQVKIMGAISTFLFGQVGILTGKAAS